ncbi:MAG: T9SS type A sorting domain-containing protein [Bacteroidetes bacterium]|nr:T9SS type A sorting domain-containing protein [Bacteroidota bacterium]
MKILNAFSLGLLGCSVAMSGQTNLAVSASVTADTFLVDFPPSAAIDGDTTGAAAWIATALDTSNTDEINIAPLSTASADTYNTGNGGRPPEDAIDGITGEWTGWEASAGASETPHWLELSWPSAQSVYKVVLYTNPKNLGDWTIRGYTVQYWDGTGYQDLDTVSGNSSEVVTSTFDTVTTTKIRIYCTESDISSSFYRISELEVYSVSRMETHWLDLSWDSEQNLGKVILYTPSNSDQTLKGFDIQYWDGEAFQTAASVSGNTAARVTSRFASVSTTKLRILCTEPDVSDKWYRINEVEVYDDQIPTVDDSTWNLDFETINYFFPSPPNEYRMIDYSSGFQQGTIDQLKGYGFGGVQTHVAFNNYLQSEAKWDVLVSDVDLATENDMEVWIHDERGYPSGAAGGLVVEGHPELENRGVIRIKQNGTGEVAVHMELPAEMEFFHASLASMVNGEPDYENAVEVSIADHKIDTIGLSGSWQLSVFGIKILDQDTQAQSNPQFGGTGHYPSLLSEAAMKRFIELTHQNYANHINSIGNKVEKFYTNEASLNSTYWQYDGSEAEYAYLPWEKDLPNQFRAMHGYDLIPSLDALFEGPSSASRMVRLHFFQTVGEVMARNFSGLISEWCHENGVQLSGHPLLEEYMIHHAIFYGDFMKVMRNYDVPSCDLPVARPGKQNWIFWMPKFISSASYLEDKYGMVAALIDPLIGYGRDDLSPDIPYMKRTINMSFLCGVNQVNSYIPYDEYQGEEKDEFVRMGDYLSRMAMMLRGAKNEAPIAMYYPIETFQSRYIASPLPHNKIAKNYANLQSTLDRMAVEILQNGLDFNYATADAILNASVLDSVVQIGTHLYSSIIMPGVEVIPLDVLRKLQFIAEAGIPVYWVDKAPSLGIKGGEHVPVQQIASTLSTTSDPLPSLLMKREREFSIHVSSSAGVLSMSRFTRDGRRIYYIINDSENEITITAESGLTDTVQVYDPVSGEISETVLPLTENIGGYESLFLVEALSVAEIEPITIDAGPDTILCEANFQEYQPGNFVSIEGGSPPYSFSWSCEYRGLTGTFYASTFLNDTSISHPTFISAFDTLSFTLEVSDNHGNSASDNLRLIISRFNSCLADCVESIYEGDSVQLGHCIGGGTQPYSISWEPAGSLSNPAISNPWAKPDSDTKYTIILTDAAGCRAVSSCRVKVLPTGLNEKTLLNQGISLYPNPAHTNIHIEVTDDLIASELRIIDISGRVMENNIIRGKQTTINISHFHPGMYYVKIAGKAFSMKLIIN